MRRSLPLSVDDADTMVLEGWAASGTGAVRRRARIVLLSARGDGPSQVAAAVGCSVQTVITWRERYRSAGLDGLRDAPRSGRPARLDPVTVLRRSLAPPAPDLPQRRWSSRLLAAELGVSNVAVASVWRHWGVTPLPGGGLRIGSDPPLDPPLGVPAGVHVAPGVAVLGLAAAAPDADPAEPAAEPGDGTDLEVLVTGADGPGVGDFLDRLAPGVRLLVDHPAEEVRRWARRHGAPVHHAPGAVPWARLARAALLVSAAGPGAAAAADLERAVRDHRPGTPLTWLW